MSITKDWRPANRDGQLSMAGDWSAVCAAWQTGWNIPASALAELTTLRGTAAALETAKTETTRTPVATAKCKEAFDALTSFMRDFKRIWYSVLGPSEAPPDRPDDLRKSFSRCGKRT
jgi:hypothetical protein